MRPMLVESLIKETVELQGFRVAAINSVFNRFVGDGGFERR